ncbi:MAG: hypothetical protein FJ149_06355 [Euryarchaeota archaeon]|nr:hypothetical protein [Euryarchaeota archaeon]
MNIKIRESTKGKVIFRNDTPITIEPGGTPVVVQLSRPETDIIPKFGDMLNVEVVDADDEELLLKQEVTLKVDMDEWQ